MKPKKTKRASLENKKDLFIEIGFVIALGLVLLAFEWTTKPETAEGSVHHSYCIQVAVMCMIVGTFR